MKQIILNCSWNPGEYSIVLTWDDNGAHYNVKQYHLGETTERSVDVNKETFKKFLDKIVEIDFLGLDREYLPEDGVFVLDGKTFDFLYVDGNRFCASKWQLGTEDENIMNIEDAIAIVDPKFMDLFPIIE